MKVSLRKTLNMAKGPTIGTVTITTKAFTPEIRSMDQGNWSKVTLSIEEDSKMAVWMDRLKSLTTPKADKQEKRQ